MQGSQPATRQMSDHLYCRGIQPVTNKKNTFLKLNFENSLEFFVCFQRRNRSNSQQMKLTQNLCQNLVTMFSLQVTAAVFLHSLLF